MYIKPASLNLYTNMAGKW